MRLPTAVIRYVPYVGPVVQRVSVGLNAKEILESSTPLEAVKTIGGFWNIRCISFNY